MKQYALSVHNSKENFKLELKMQDTKEILVKNTGLKN